MLTAVYFYFLLAAAMALGAVVPETNASRMARGLPPLRPRFLSKTDSGKDSPVVTGS